MASSLHSQDADFLASIAGGETAEGEPWSFVRRGGRVLLACRRERRCLASALALYQPQRPAARLLRSLLSAGAPWGLVKWLPFRSFAADAGRPVAHIERTFGVRIPAMLLGNPTQIERRAVLIAEGGRAGTWVFKLGTHPVAVAAIRREAGFLAAWGGRLPGIPGIQAEASGQDWHAFAIPYLDGRGVGESDLKSVTHILESWLLPESPRQAGMFPAWQALEGGGFQELGRRLYLRPSMVHRDLAPWNLIKTPDGRVIAIDWENGEAGGVPGWDLVHFFFQIGSLVKRLPARALVDGLFRSFDSPAVRHYLDATGWGTEVPWLVASYLVQRSGTGDEIGREALAVVLERV